MKLTYVLLRVGVWFFTIVELAVGVVATLAPRAFYDHVPWVNLAPPYAEHLMRDYGAMNLALALVFLVAAITMDRLMVPTALAAYVVFAIPHLLFHITHHQHYSTTATVLLPIALLILHLRDGDMDQHAV